MTRSRSTETKTMHIIEFVCYLSTDFRLVYSSVQFYLSTLIVSIRSLSYILVVGYVLSFDHYRIFTYRILPFKKQNFSKNISGAEPNILKGDSNPWNTMKRSYN